MPTETIHYRFLVRGGTAADLAAVNEVPKARELIAETDTGKLKLGNGEDAYLDLPYLTTGGGGGGGGEPVEFQASATHIQWRPITDPVSAWVDLVPLSALKGADGEDGDDGADSTVPGPPGDQVELEADATHISWRYVGDLVWIDLVALADLKGDQGDPGPEGGPSLVTSIAANTTLGAGHVNRWVEVSSGPVIKLPATGATWAVGDFAELCQADASPFSVLADTGATLLPHTADLIDVSRYQGGVVVVKVIAANTWRVGGALADAP